MSAGTEAFAEHLFDTDATVRHSAPSRDAWTSMGPVFLEYETSTLTAASMNLRPATSWAYTTSDPAFTFQQLELNEAFL